jgi:DNA excision repair protein ERCC-4
MDGYLKASFKELFAEDGLTIMGRGLGIQNLFSKFAQYYSSKESGRKLVFCLNCTGVEDQLHDLFISNACPGSRNLPQVRHHARSWYVSSNKVSIKNRTQVINNEVTAQDRIEKYMQGGCYIITSRILIVDLLDNKVDANSISGLLVYNAHRLAIPYLCISPTSPYTSIPSFRRISETSVESFIIKVFRERNRLGFVKGFSEDPEALQGGFGKVERLMRVLYVRRLYLWPRFRLEIVEALKKSREPEVVELVTGLTPHMKSIQSAVLAAMNTCIQELKKAAPHLETSQMTLENGLFQAFDLAIKK